MPTSRELPGPEGGDFGQYCATEEWSGNLKTGLFTLSPTARRILGLNGRKGCGLLTLIQCFDRADQRRLIDLFERAASEPMRFSFSTTVTRHGKAGQTVFCIGRSEGHDTAEGGRLRGVLIFPHL